MPGAPIAFLDAHYVEDGGRVACVIAAHWEDAAATTELSLPLEDVAPYRPGYFYERELPGLLRVLALAPRPLSAVVVDGYVELDANGSPGLGAHLHERLGGTIPVVGIAKRAYRGSEFAARVLRGNSRSPLFVTARGMSPEDAAQRVSCMHGPHRIPSLVTRVDHLARGIC